ncbi:HNH endonuclease [Blautia glucerasea]|uniref:GmrSD restriction endonuclease domain-containing protein n=1 Tax=Blautia TaxID=572511 RepID=UPI00156DA92A|nr:MULTISPECIES: DUF262 domain-containing protein [Blautia]MCB5381680.1 HNH endonuclease [Blautia glucerasea]NSJ69809.1 DUF262 domain-containing protein [Blautia faecis]
MKIEPKEISIREVAENYVDDGDGGVYGLDGELVLRPPYQREYIFGQIQRNAVIDTVMHGFPLNLMYWSPNPKGFELLDGQQRTISICQYVNGDFPVKINGNDKFFHNLTEDEKQKFLDYKLDVKICDGTEEEKLEWFKRINIAGLVLTNQELLNATYVGTWLADAKNYFSKRNCVAGQMAEGYIKGNPIRQDYLEKALAWIADRDGLESGQMYMAKHQHDLDANELWLYFQTVINWAKMLFPNARKGVTDVQDWGILYNEFHNRQYNSNNLEADMKRLLMDDDVTKNAGIVRYLLSDRTKHDEKFLSIRAFTDTQKRRAYERQEHKCAICGEVFDLKDMDGDHIVPWSQGGRTVDENLQMLCKKCNNEKSDK